MPEFFDPESTTIDLRDALTQYWLGTMNDTQVGPPERMKASENLAKFILGLGQTKVKIPKGGHRPATADILKLVDAIDAEEEKSEDDEAIAF